MKLKILVLFGTRPELIKMSMVINYLKVDDNFTVKVVSTSQHREMLEGLFTLFSIQPDYDLGIIRQDQTLAGISARTLQGLDPIMRDEKPDMLLVQGDTTSAFIGALTAFYHKIPVGHVEAGLRSFDKLHPYPEEINRRLLSTLADLHFAPLPSNKQNLLQEGVDAEKIYVTGNTVIDALHEISGRNSDVLEKYIPADSLAEKRLVLVTAHRRESFDQHLSGLCHAIRELVDAYPDVMIVYPVHMNPNVQQAVFPILRNCDRIHLLEPLPYEAFVAAMSKAYLIITDSGGVQEEAPSLGKPVLVYRKVTERGEGVSANGARIVGLDPEKLVKEAGRLLDDKSAYENMVLNRDVYGDGQASRRIAQAIWHRFNASELPDSFAGPAAG